MLSEKRSSILAAAEAYAAELFKNEFSGHDLYHTLRVRRLALRLAREEGADEFIVQLAALLHDADDVKLSPSTAEGLDNAVGFMKAEGVEGSDIELIVRIIKELSFKGSDTAAPTSIEGKCVQDADRLDALGAIGIGRTFAYGGSKKRPMYDPDIPPKLGMSEAEYRANESTSINHFYEKLLLLADMMNTPSAKRIAEERTGYMRGFVERFIAEWNGEM